MKRTLFRTGAAAILPIVLTIGCGGRDKPEVKKEDEIPLKSLHVSFAQEGTQDVEKGGGKAAKFFQTWDGALQSGASNLFLVRGKTVDDAATAADNVMTVGSHTDTPIPRKGAQGQPYWLVVVLGRGPRGPSEWQVESVKKTGKVVRLTVAHPKRVEATKDNRLYLVWVPLGKLEDGIYRFELMEKGAEEPSLLRRVVVKD